MRSSPPLAGSNGCTATDHAREDLDKTARQAQRISLPNLDRTGNQTSLPYLLYGPDGPRVGTPYQGGTESLPHVPRERYCLTFPEWVGAYDCTAVPASRGNEETDCVSVVPSAAVKRLIPRDPHEYARVGGVLWEHLGGRRFRGTTSLSTKCEAALFTLSSRHRLQPPLGSSWNVPGEGIVCLW